MNRSFWYLVAAQCQVFINDNAAKLMLMVLATAVLPGDQAKPFYSFLAGLVVLPFIVLSPTVGWLADRYSKRDVLYYSQYLQIGSLVLMLLAIAFENLLIAVVAFLLLGIQCAIFAPAKQGLVKELVGSQKLSTAVGRVEVTAVLSILFGTLVGGTLFDGYRWLYAGDGTSELDLAWQAGIASTAVLSILAVVGWWLCSQIERTPAHSREPWRASLLTEHFSQLRDVWAHRPILLSILGNSYFYALAGALYLSLLEVASGLSGQGGTGTAIRTGVFLTLLGSGMAVGSVVVSRLTLHHFELGLIPIGSLGMIVGVAALGIVPPETNWYNLALFLLGFFGSFFVVPLNAYLQEHVPPGQRGRLLSANMLLTNLVSILAILLYFFLSYVGGLKPPAQFVVYALPTVLVTLVVVLLLPARLLRFTLGMVARLIYRVRAIDVERVPATGGVLLLPNHISYVDAVMLQLACPRDIRFLVDENIYRLRWLHWSLKLLRTIPISPRRAKTAIELAADALREGEVVCIFPEGGLARTASLAKLNRGYELIARRAEVPVLPVWLENLWGSIFSYYGGRYFFKWPRALPYHVSVYFGEAIPHEQAPPERVRRALYDLGERAFRERPELAGHVGNESLKGLRHHLFRPVLTDAYQNGRSLSGAMLAGTGLALAEWLKREVPEKRVGIVLPPGLGASLANLACAFADKVPVNLNFTAGRAAAESAIRQAGIRTIITADVLADKLKDFPWTDRRLDLPRVLGGLGKPRILGWTAAVVLLPNGWLRKWAGIPETGGDSEAGLLFTSGSSGAPKGVVLTHRNIIANTAQCGAVFANFRLDTLLGCLPIFHSFGCTVTFWWPIMGGPRVVTYPTPLDTSRLAEVIQKHRVSLLLNTPTFLRNYLRKATPDQLRSLRFVVTGAEKLPTELLEAFESQFGVPVCEGYGMTEATPVVSTNVVDLPPSFWNPEGVPGRKVGSVGRLLPGISARIRHPETDEDLSIFEQGMLWLKGANIFPGYLDDELRTGKVLQDGWYKTGDIARLDEDGFLFIEGRLSRFSKIAGEMVPHGTIEAAIQSAREGKPDDEAAQPGGPDLVVVGIPDESKGEVLVVLSVSDLDLAALRPRLLAAGLPVLWVPRHVIRVEAIPVLASGKLDLVRCQQIASGGMAPAGSGAPAA